MAKTMIEKSMPLGPKQELLCIKKRWLHMFQIHSEIISFFVNESINELKELINRVHLEWLTRLLKLFFKVRIFYFLFYLHPRNAGFNKRIYAIWSRKIEDKGCIKKHRFFLFCASCSMKVGVIFCCYIWTSQQPILRGASTLVQYQGKHSKILATMFLLLQTVLNSRASHYGGHTHYFFPPY